MGQMETNRQMRLQAAAKNNQAFEDYKNNIDTAYNNARNYYASRNLNSNAMDYANKIGSAAANQVQTSARAQGMSQGQALAQARDSAAQNAVNGYGNAYSVAMNQANQLAGTEQNKMSNLAQSNSNASANFETQKSNEATGFENTGKVMDAAGSLASGLAESIPGVGEGIKIAKGILGK